MMFHPMKVYLWGGHSVNDVKVAQNAEMIGMKSVMHSS